MSNLTNHKVSLDLRGTLLPMALLACTAASACTERFGANSCESTGSCQADGGEAARSHGGGGAAVPEEAGASTGGDTGAGGELSTACAKEDVVCWASREDGTFVS